MQKPKDFYESELNVGDRVAFNYGGAVRQGIIKEIRESKEKDKYLGIWKSRDWVFKIEHLFNGGTSTVRNFDGISKIKIDLE